MKRFFLKLFILILILFFAAIFAYTKVLPFLVSNSHVISIVEKTAKKYADVDIIIKTPELKTGLNPIIEFKTDKIFVSKNNEKLFAVSDFDLSVSFDEIFKKKIKINRFGADKFFIDVDNLLRAFKMDSTNNSSNKSDFYFDFYDSVLFLNECYVSYILDNGTKVRLKATNLNVDNTQKIERFVHINFDGEIIKNKRTVKFSFKDEDKIVIKNKHIYVNDCPLTINQSKMFFNAEASREKGYRLTIYAKRFFIPDVIKLLKTNVVENNIDDVLIFLKRINGDFDFSVTLTKNDITGNIKLNKLSSKLTALANMPFTLSQGNIQITKNNLILKDFKGFYDNKPSNEFSFNGTVADYMKTVDTNIDMTALLTNDFVGKYLSETAMIPLTLVGKDKAKILIHSLGANTDVILMGKISKGNDILVDGASLSPVNYDRALKADVHIKGDIVNIETINYYIAKEINKESKGIKPILTLNGNMRISDSKILDLGFEIPNPLPSEFLNVLIGQKLFKGGKFSGNMQYIDNGVYPVINADLIAEKIRIPSQRLVLKNGKIITDKNLIKINAEGKFRRCSYLFNGEIVNAIKYPIVIKHTDLTIDNLDIARVMKAFSQPVQSTPVTAEVIDDENNDDVPMTFDVKNLIVEESLIHIIKGKYKEINFSDVKAKMSLDKESIFRLKSNRFDIAEGHSSADINCDLKNQKYNIKLGIKDVNSDLMSTAILNLKREISGKASGLIDLNTDDSLKLNGSIKFIVKDGTIQKIGLIEYVLKFAALFRNPLAMISPSVFSDLVNIPEGNFDKITGDLKLKDNKVELLRIKSQSPQLSAYIVGCYNLENNDAILRIYTKFSNRNKGFGGFLRNLSLNSLANRIPLNSRNDSNYYASELSQLPPIDAEEKDCQIFLTKVDGDVQTNNFISSLKKIK